jgi:hypothetical protein
MCKDLKPWPRIESRMINEGVSCMWEINRTSCRKQEAKLIATKTNVDELAGANKFIVVDNCELFYSKR